MARYALKGNYNPKHFVLTARDGSRLEISPEEAEAGVDTSSHYEDEALASHPAFKLVDSDAATVDDAHTLNEDTQGEN
jgi:hypothetical protein